MWGKEPEKENNVARITIDHPRTLTVRGLEWYSKRKYGAVLEPGLVAFNNRRVFRSYLRLELGAARWNQLDVQLKSLAVMKAATELGCSWCLDFGFWESFTIGIPAEKIDAIAHHNDSELFTTLEKQVMSFAAAMTRTRVDVTDSQVRELRKQLGESALVELTFMIALENQRSRVNLAMGLTSQGFRELCEVALHDTTA